MRQVNKTGYEQHISAWPTDKYPNLPGPFSVADGEETDLLPELLAGFEEVVEDPAPKSRRKDATAVADTKEGEPQ